MPKRSPRPTLHTPSHSFFAGRPRALAALRLSCLTSVTTSPDRQRSAIQLSAEQVTIVSAALPDNSRPVQPPNDRAVVTDVLAVRVSANQ